MPNVQLDVDSGAFASGSVVVIAPGASAVSAVLTPNTTTSFAVAATDASDFPVKVAFTNSGGFADLASFLPAGPFNYTVNNSSSTFSYTPDNQFIRAFNKILPIGTAMTLAGMVPGGFSGGTTYYVVSSASGTFALSATRGGSPISATTSGAGAATVTRYLYSGLVNATPGSVKAFTAYGTPTPGYTLAADSDGAAVWTPPVSASLMPADVGVIAWTASPGNYSQNVVYTAASFTGKLILWTFKSFNGGVVNNINYGVDVIGNTLANCFLGIYDMAGNLLGTSADQSTNMTSGASSRTAALTTPVTLAANSLYRIGLVMGSATTAPTFTSSSSSASPNFTNTGITAANSIAATFGALNTYTALPATYTPGSITATAGTPIFVLT